MSSELRPIEPKSQRWEPTVDPNDIFIPGLDTTAQVYDQIEQIEQLITIKLQNVDANFSKMQQIMANRILPAVKRYAVGTGPVREAAKFWTTFYEQAAQIRVPTYEEYSSVHEPQEQGSASESEAEQGQTSAGVVTDGETTPTNSRHTFNPDGISSDVSFMPGQAAISSTPATTSRHRTLHAHDSFASQGSDPTPSWTASLESPLVRLDREIQSLTEDDEHFIASTSQAGRRYDDSQEATQRHILPQEPTLPQLSFDGGKGKAREAPQPLLHNVLRRNASSTEPSSLRTPGISPLKVKPKTPILKGLNPYLPTGTKPTEWKGVINLNDPSTPRRGYSSSFKDTTLRPGAAQPTTPGYNEEDSLDDNFGLSPPITTDFARLPKLGRTPKKEAAERIFQNLVAVERRGPFAAEKRNGAPKGDGTLSSASSVPTPPSLSRYSQRQPETSGSVTDASLDSMMRRVGLNIPGFSSVYGAAARASYAPAPPPREATPPAEYHPPPAPAPTPPRTPEQFQFNAFHLQDEELEPLHAAAGADDSLDSLDYEDHNTANPSEAFLLASQRGGAFDDSFGSDGSDDSLEDDEGMEPVHPFARALPADGEEFDDSFEDSLDAEAPEETVFGVTPAQRLQMQAAYGSGQDLRMLGEDLLQDTIGIGTQMVQAGRVEESPTPWVGGKVE